ncbi:MAG: DUF429 domain-containing protein [Fimbriimonadaceae bacterium]|nr:DUF429 domain-containing protein [Fimbriimonadaceae bacterium]
MIYLGVDLAWGEGTEEQSANLSGVVALSATGKILDAGWCEGVADVASWMDRLGGSSQSLGFIDAPLVVTNPAGQRLCETEVGRRYGRWKVSAHSTNQNSANKAGVRLREELERRGWSYHDGVGGPPSGGRQFSECYPYTTIVGAEELGYEDERPPYKKLNQKLPASERRASRASICDELISRIAGLAKAQPPIDLLSHEVTASLVLERSPTAEKAHKQREDLLDAAICAWTAALWDVRGFARCQVLGVDNEGEGSNATIIAPAKPEQRVESRT